MKNKKVGEDEMTNDMRDGNSLNCNKKVEENGACGDVCTPYIIGMGNPLLDLIAEVPIEFLEKYKLKLDNGILADEKLHGPLYDELEKNYKVDYVAGGAAQNAIRLCQALIDKPNVTGYIGCIGDDEHGKTMRELIEKEGVYSLYSCSEKCKDTGVCAVLLNSKDRSLCTKLSAADHYKLEYLTQNEKTWKCILNARIFFSAGFFLTVCPEAMKKVGEHCAETNKIFCTSFSAEFLIEYFKEPMMEVLEYADYVFSNEVEYLHFGKIHNFQTENLEVIAEKILNLPKKNKKRNRTVIVTQGSKHVIVATKWLDDAVQIKKYSVIAVPKESIIDTNGAGDAFVGGFLYGLYREETIDFCVTSGICAATHIIQNSGCTFDKNVLKNSLNNCIQSL